MTLNAFRFIVAFLVLGLIFWKHVVHINRTTLWYSLIVGLALAGTYVAYNYGITRTSLSNAAFICALQVIFAPLLGFLFFRQRPGWKLGGGAGGVHGGHGPADPERGSCPPPGT